MEYNIFYQMHTYKPGSFWTVIVTAELHSNLYRAIFGGNVMITLMPYYLGQSFTVASSGKEKDKQIPKKNVSHQVRGVTQHQGVYTIV